jgi:hypothetical protein
MKLFPGMNHIVMDAGGNNWSGFGADETFKWLHNQLDD